MTIARPLHQREDALSRLPGGKGVLVIGGPDGTGKSTLSRGLADSIVSPVRVIHHRPGILPQRVTDEVTDPRARPPYGPFISLLKITYVWCDFLIGWLLCVRPLAKQGWVIIERGWPDILIDPLRYRIAGGRRLTRFLGRLTPIADLCIVLEAPVRTLLERKTELSADELARHAREWRTMSRLADHTVYIDATRDVAHVLRDSFDAIARARFVEARSGPGWTSIPRRRSPRWILPRGPRKVAAEALRIYQPVTIRGLVGWTAARAFARVGGFRLLPRSYGPPSEVISALARLDRSSELSVAVMKTQVMGGWTAMLVDRNGRSRLIGSVATSDEARQRLKKKHAATCLVYSMPPPLSTPWIVVHSPSLLLFEPVAWRLRWRPWRISPEVAAPMGAYHAASSGNGRRSPSHNDFAPWNVLRSRDGWVVLDWEDPDWRVEEPFHDLFHYLVQSHALLGRPSRRALLAGLKGRGWVGAAIEAYRSAARRQVEDVRTSFVSYLQSSIPRVDLSVPEGAKAVRAREKLLRRLKAIPTRSTS
jgi:hypothetical protein